MLTKWKWFVTTSITGVSIKCVVWGLRAADSSREGVLSEWVKSILINLLLLCNLYYILIFLVVLKLKNDGRKWNRDNATWDPPTKFWGPGFCCALLLPGSFRYVQLSSISGFWGESGYCHLFSESFNKSLETYLRDTVSSVPKHCSKASHMNFFIS